MKEILLVAVLTWTASASEQQQAKAILDASGVKGGLVVHLGCGDGKLTAALHANDSYVVQGLDADVTAARKYIQSVGLCGPVSAAQWTGDRLPYIDNLANLIVADRLGKISIREVMRVLAPHGVAFIGGKKTVKPWPKDIDEWTHYLHGPSNNAVAHDREIGPPRHMQWLGNPTWTRNHDKLCSISSVVSAEGRVFCIVDEATAANMKVPGKWFVVARDAFSGIQLWERPMASWVSTQIRFRTGPAQVTRLLVASGDRLYVPLGLNAPVSELDAATGKTLRTFDATAGAEEIVLVDGMLLVVKGEPTAEQTGFLKAPNQKTIVAIDSASGRSLWTWSDPGKSLRPETLGADGRRVFVQVGEGVVCLELASGKRLWASDGTAGQKADRKPARKKGVVGVSYGNYTLVVADDVVLCNLSGKLTALSADTGTTLWSCPAGGGFHSPLDVFVINGLVWQGSHVSDSVAPPSQGFREGRDLHTGEIKKTNQILVDLQTAGHHHRCYREKATERYILTGKRGIELVDLVGNDQSRNNWVRGTCQYGIMPANGLLYAPSHDCACYMESLLKGFWALSAQQPVVTEAIGNETEGERLEKGHAYGMPATAATAEAESWPQYRHDPLRSGTAATVLPSQLEPAWKTQLGSRLTQPVIADGKVLLAASDEDTVYALDAATGTVAWKYVCGGRVDSPPTIDHGLALFGSADGWVYCLRLADGALVWRFLAAPADLRAVAYDRVESVWPVHGSVLVLHGVAYCSAGRSTWLDGGIVLYGLDPATGHVLCKNHFQSRHPVYLEGKEKAKPEYITRVSQNTTDYKTILQPDHSDSFSMGGTTSDVLVSDGRNVFLHQVRFDAKLERQDRMTRHLFATFSLLDDAENHRSYWMLGTGDFRRTPVSFSWIARSPDRFSPTLAVPSGLMLAFDEHALWGVQRQGNATGTYHLYMKPNTPFSEQENPQPDFRRAVSQPQRGPAWKQALPVRPRAMLKSGPNLYLGASPSGLTAYEGPTSGMIWVVSATDGTKVAEYRLDAPVVWDGLAAANSRLYAATADGNLVCYRGVQ